MGKAIHRLTAQQVFTAERDGNDGGGLVLRIKPGGAAWTWRYTAPDGRRREIGLGSCPRGSIRQAGESLARVRQAVALMQAKLLQGVDPLAQRQQTRADAERKKAENSLRREAEHWTLRRCARDYHARAIEPRRTAKHAAQWIASIENHLPAALLDRPIAAVTAPELVRALVAMRPHRRARHFGKADRMGETRQRVTQRLVAVWDDAVFHGRAATNAASAARRKLAEEAPPRRRGHHRALAYGDAPAAIRAIRQADGTAARALEFALLTACRTAEALGARWDEIDLTGAVWRIPAARMKARRPHDVPLSRQALRVLETMRGQHAEWVFPSPSGDRPLSNMAMLKALDRLDLRAKTTVHGLCRATFSTWANETNAARADVIEAALAHAPTDAVRAAYNRATFERERRELLQAWADHVAPLAQVLPLHAA